MVFGLLAIISVPITVIKAQVKPTSPPPIESKPIKHPDVYIATLTLKSRKNTGGVYIQAIGKISPTGSEALQMKFDVTAPNGSSQSYIRDKEENIYLAEIADKQPCSNANKSGCGRYIVKAYAIRPSDQQITATAPSQQITIDPSTQPGVIGIPSEAVTPGDPSIISPTVPKNPTSGDTTESGTGVNCESKCKDEKYFGLIPTIRSAICNSQCWVINTLVGILDWIINTIFLPNTAI